MHTVNENTAPLCPTDLFCGIKYIRVQLESSFEIIKKEAIREVVRSTKADLLVHASRFRTEFDIG